MSVKIVIPNLGESVAEATISKWYKKVGDRVELDEILLELETEKVNLEVNASAAGVIGEIMKQSGSSVEPGDIVGSITEGAAVNDSQTLPANNKNNVPSSPPPQSTTNISQNNEAHPPSVNKLLKETNIDSTNIEGSGKRGMLTKGDVLNVLANTSENKTPKTTNKHSPSNPDKPTEKIVMSRLRQTIAKRLKDSQNTAAILTTFNEINMQRVMDLRIAYKDEFEKKHQAKLGFMSFFVAAAVNALKAIPSINAEIDGDAIVYKYYYDIGVAVGSPQGLVVPIVRNCENLNFAQIETEIVNLSKKARDGKLAMSDLSGGTFTISNGGVYGSLLSTPIINPPQSGILGLHKIEERAIVINGKIEIRPMMYIALSYDHRLIDGKEAVTFLVKIKEAIENPERLLLNV